MFSNFTKCMEETILYRDKINKLSLYYLSVYAGKNCILVFLYTHNVRKYLLTRSFLFI